MSPTRGLLGVVVLAVVCLAAAADDPQAELAKKPQWQRLLMGEDAKKAETLEKAIEEQEQTDAYAEAIQSAKELLTLRVKVQGPDHYEAVTAKYKVSRLEKLAARPAADHKRWRA